MSRRYLLQEASVLKDRYESGRVMGLGRYVVHGCQNHLAQLFWPIHVDPVASTLQHMVDSCPFVCDLHSQLFSSLGQVSRC